MRLLTCALGVLLVSGCASPSSVPQSRTSNTASGRDGAVATDAPSSMSPGASPSVRPSVGPPVPTRQGRDPAYDAMLGREDRILDSFEAVNIFEDAGLGRAKVDYKLGEPVRLRLRMCNVGAERVAIRYPDSQRFDVYIKPRGPNQAEGTVDTDIRTPEGKWTPNPGWQWSDEQTFTITPFEELWDPGQCRTYDAGSWDQHWSYPERRKVSSGRYSMGAIVIGGSYGMVFSTRGGGELCIETSKPCLLVE